MANSPGPADLLRVTAIPPRAPPALADKEQELNPQDNPFMRPMYAMDHLTFGLPHEIYAFLVGLTGIFSEEGFGGRRDRVRQQYFDDIHAYEDAYPGEAAALRIFGDVPFAWVGPLPGMVEEVTYNEGPLAAGVNAAVVSAVQDMIFGGYVDEAADLIETLPLGPTREVVRRLLDAVDMTGPNLDPPGGKSANGQTPAGEANPEASLRAALREMLMTTMRSAPVQRDAAAPSSGVAHSIRRGASSSWDAPHVLPPYYGWEPAPAATPPGSFARRPVMRIARQPPVDVLAAQLAAMPVPEGIAATGPIPRRVDMRVQLPASVDEQFRERLVAPAPDRGTAAGTAAGMAEAIRVSTWGQPAAPTERLYSGISYDPEGNATVVNETMHGTGRASAGKRTAPQVHSSATGVTDAQNDPNVEIYGSETTSGRRVAVSQPMLGRPSSSPARLTEYPDAAYDDIYGEEPAPAGAAAPKSKPSYGLLHTAPLVPGGPPSYPVPAYRDPYLDDLELTPIPKPATPMRKPVDPYAGLPEDSPY